METGRLKRQFGDRLCFHGLLDCQELMPKATGDEVAAQVRRLTEVAGENGGLALSPNCGFQVDVPVENVLAACDAPGA